MYYRAMLIIFSVQHHTTFTGTIIVKKHFEIKSGVQQLCVACQAGLIQATSPGGKDESARTER